MAPSERRPRGSRPLSEATARSGLTGSLGDGDACVLLTRETCGLQALSPTPRVMASGFLCCTENSKFRGVDLICFDFLGFLVAHPKKSLPGPIRRLFLPLSPKCRGFESDVSGCNPLCVTLSCDDARVPPCRSARGGPVSPTPFAAGTDGPFPTVCCWHRRHRSCDPREG